MSILEGFLEFMTNSLPGAFLDTTMGRGGDGIPGSSAESYVRNDDPAKNANILINAGNIELHAQNVAVTQAAPLPEASPVDQAAARQAEEAAFNQALAQARQDQEQTQGQRL